MYTALVSRQFVDMSRIRIEGLLAAFPKLIGTGKQHTYVETDSVRYLYQPLEVCYDIGNFGFAINCNTTSFLTFSFENLATGTVLQTDGWMDVFVCM